MKQDFRFGKSIIADSYGVVLRLANNLFFQRMLLVICFVVLFQTLTAQSDSINKYLLTTKSSVIEFGPVKIIDPYFTTTQYSGSLLSYRQNSSRFFNPQRSNLSMQSVFALSGGWLHNPAESGGMFYAAARAGWGVNYHFRVSPKLMLLAGGLWDAEIGLKELPRYVNNPFNMDLATNINVTGTAYWNFHFLRRDMRFMARLESPVLGYMFVPESGASYYEMFQLGNMNNTFHFSTITNRQGFNQTYKLDIPLRWMVLQLGVRCQYLKYKANDMVFTNNQFAFVLGSTFDVISFGGRKRKAPSNFLNSTY